jgi:hypothetical protein
MSHVRSSPPGDRSPPRLTEFVQAWPGTANPIVLLKLCYQPKLIGENSINSFLVETEAAVRGRPLRYRG